MKTTISKSFIILSIIALSLTSCLKDLDRTPFYGLNTESVYADPDNYIEVLAKLYAGFTTTGNQGRRQSLISAASMKVFPITSVYSGISRNCLLMKQ
ncbi:MAG: hypothetical protein IPG01_02395 [Chitinophagaceae bacterium]|nr:hypothetical protein [Chitinophagaceae bacterium]